jgi:hypothetical protein
MRGSRAHAFATQNESRGLRAVPPRPVARFRPLPDLLRNSPPCGDDFRAVPAWAPGSLTNRTIRFGPRDPILPFTVSCSPQPAVRYRPSLPLKDSPANVVSQRTCRFAAGKPMGMAARPAYPLRRIASGGGPVGMVTFGRPSSCAAQAPLPLLASGVLHSGTAVPDALRTSNFAGGLCELA